MQSLIIFYLLAGIPVKGYGQSSSWANELSDSLKRQEELQPHVVWYIPGANFGIQGDTNLFTKTYCRQMREIMESKFVLLHCSDKKHSVNNVLWALWHAQYPLRNPAHDSRIRNALKTLASDTLNWKSHISLVSSSYGTVVAAQLALYLVNNRQKLGLGTEPVNVVFGASMLSEKSRLFKELERLKNDNQIGCIVYDELQFPGDNVTGMCGRSRLHAITEVCRIAFPVFGTYKGQPSILNKDPLTGHIHRKREISANQVNDYISIPLIDYELAGPWFKIRAAESISR